jgi:hypothetical protein
LALSKELNLQRDQLRWNRWGNPAFVAIAAGLIGYVSTLYSSYSTRQLEADRQRNTERLEQENHESTLTLEREKQEATPILEAIKTGGTGEDKEKRTAANLVFLTDAGLIKSIKEDELDRLRKIAGETLPSLPASEPFEFKPSSTLTTDLQTKLTNALSDYETYLATLGFESKPPAEKIGIRVDESDPNNIQFDGKDIILGQNLLSDPENTLYEFNYYFLKQSNPRAFNSIWSSGSFLFSSLIQGLKYYFVCSYRNDPYVERSSYSQLGGLGPPNLKDLKAFEKEDSSPLATEPHHLGMIWAGAFWELREKLGQTKTDKLILAAWKRLDPKNMDPNNTEFFINAILDANQELGVGVDPVVVREAFKRRKLL